MRETTDPQHSFSKISHSGETANILPKKLINNVKPSIFKLSYLRFYLLKYQNTNFGSLYASDSYMVMSSITMWETNKLPTNPKPIA